MKTSDLVPMLGLAGTAVLFGQLRAAADPGGAGDVGIGDFLALLANRGPCPSA